MQFQTEVLLSDLTVCKKNLKLFVCSVFFCFSSVGYVKDYLRIRLTTD